MPTPGRFLRLCRCDSTAMPKLVRDPVRRSSQRSKLGILPALRHIPLQPIASPSWAASPSRSDFLERNRLTRSATVYSVYAQYVYENQSPAMKDARNKLIIPPVSPAVAGPLYRQIVDGFKSEISAGRLRPGQSLPSFRALAEDLLVSLITVKRAYEELEREGIVFSKQGLGTFVADTGPEKHRAARRQDAEALLEQAIAAAAQAELSPRDILRLAQRILEQKKGEFSK